MDDSRRLKILKNVVEVLQTLSGPPYSLSVPVENVSRMVVSVETAPSLPYISVRPTAENLATGGVINKTTLNMRVAVRVMLEASEVDIPDAIEHALADIRHLMMVDRFRGQSALDTSYVGCEEPVIHPGDTSKSQLDISFDVLYRTDEDDPTKP